jgi:hypothetical protein
LSESNAASGATGQSNAKQASFQCTARSRALASEALSVSIRSITSPDGAKRLYLDPLILPCLSGRRVADGWWSVSSSDDGIIA